MIVDRSRYVAILAGLVLIVGGGLAVGVWGVYLSAPGGAGSPEIPFTVAPGTPARAIAGKLEEEGLIRSGRAFRYLIRAKGASQKLRAGEFPLSAAMSAPELLDALVEGPVVLHQVTIPEGFTARQIAERLEQEGFGSAERYRELMFSPEFSRSLGVEIEEGQVASLEGYLFATTYSFAKPTDEVTVLRKMVHTLHEHLPPDALELGKKHGLQSLHRILTLASIVEKETGASTERPLIASVFLNRLKRGMRLETDPTVIYGMGDAYKGNIRKGDLQAWTPYNTYKIQGLPPGPIASPGAGAINAVLHPAETNYLFFVAKGSAGEHYFSSTLGRHAHAVRYYQLKQGPPPPGTKAAP